MKVPESVYNFGSDAIRIARSVPPRLKPYRGPIFYFAWTVVASLVPLWLGLLLLIAYGKWNHDWTLFYVKGEFYLYSAAYFANAIYLLRKKKAEEGGVHFLLTLTAALLLVIVAALYASLNTSQVIFAQAATFTPTFLRRSSVILFSISMIFSLYALVADFDPSQLPTNRDIRNKQVEEIDKELNEEET